MDVSELRKRILRALDDSRKELSARRGLVDAAATAYDLFLENTAVPMMRQAASVLVAAGHPYSVHTPARAVRLAADGHPETFIELELDTNRSTPAVLGRVCLTRGRRGVIVDEREIAAGKPVADLTEEDLAAFLTTEIPRLINKP
jgi:hypothetical protein